jgi:hydrogenase maturation protein HypF
MAADAASEPAAAALRARKHREDKPFAVMTADLEQAGQLCEIDAVAAGLLTSRSRPIVLLSPRRVTSLTVDGRAQAQPADREPQLIR